MAIAVRFAKNATCGFAEQVPLGDQLGHACNHATFHGAGGLIWKAWNVDPRKLTAGGPQNDGLEKVTGPYKNGNCWYLC